MITIYQIVIMTALFFVPLFLHELILISYKKLQNVTKKHKKV